MRDYRTQIMQQVASKTTGTYMNIQLRLMVPFFTPTSAMIFLLLPLFDLIFCCNAFLFLKKHRRIN